LTATIEGLSFPHGEGDVSKPSCETRRRRLIALGKGKRRGFDDGKLHSRKSVKEKAGDQSSKGGKSRGRQKGRAGSKFFIATGELGQASCPRDKNIKKKHGRLSLASWEEEGGNRTAKKRAPGGRGCRTEARLAKGGE